VLHCSTSQKQVKQRKFVPLTSLSPGSSKLSISNNLPAGSGNVKSLELDSDSEEHLIVDESLNLKSGGRTAKPHLPLESGPLKLKLAGLFGHLLSLRALKLQKCLLCYSLASRAHERSA
jgi:hypothetical protein